MTTLDTSALPDKAAFAIANRWQYEATSPAPEVDVPFFQRLQNATVTDRFSDPSFDAGTVSGAVTGGEATFSVGYLAVHLTGSLPRFELVSTLDNASRAWSEPALLPEGKRVPLVGDAADSFLLYAAEGHQGDALDIFSPDLLALLRGPAGDFDAEIINDVFLATANRPFDLGDPAVWEQLDGIRSNIAAKDLTPTQRPVASLIKSPGEVAMVASLGATAIGTGVGVIAAIVGGVVAVVGTIIGIVAVIAFR